MLSSASLPARPGMTDIGFFSSLARTGDRTSPLGERDRRRGARCSRTYGVLLNRLGTQNWLGAHAERGLRAVGELVRRRVDQTRTRRRPGSGHKKQGGPMPSPRRHGLTRRLFVTGVIAAGLGAAGAGIASAATSNGTSSPSSASSSRSAHSSAPSSSATAAHATSGSAAARTHHCADTEGQAPASNSSGSSSSAN